MNKIFSAVALLALAVLLAPTMSEAAKKPLVIKVGHGLTEASAEHLGWMEFKKLINERTNGEIICEIYPNQQLGGDRELIEGTQLGSVTATTVSSSPLAAFQKDFFVLDMPFLFANRTEAFAALDGKFGQELDKRLEAVNLIGLGYWENGFRNLTNSRNAVRTPADVKGLKLRTMENAVHLAAWKILNANPTPMAFGELFTAMQQKTVDGQENPFAQIYDNKFFEVQPFMTKTQHIFTPFPVIMNKEFFDDLSAEQQEIVKKSIYEAGLYQRKVSEELEDSALEKLRANGCEIIELTPDELEAFRKAVAPVEDDIKGRVSPEAFALYKEYVDSRK